MTGQGLVAEDGSIRPDNGRRRKCIRLVMVDRPGARWHRAGLEELADRTRTAQHRLAADVMRNARLCVVVRLAVVLMTVGLVARRMHQSMGRMHPKNRSEHRCKSEDMSGRDCAAGLHIICQYCRTPKAKPTRPLLSNSHRHVKSIVPTDGVSWVASEYRDHTRFLNLAKRAGYESRMAEMSTIS